MNNPLSLTNAGNPAPAFNNVPPFHREQIFRHSDSVGDEPKVHRKLRETGKKTEASSTDEKPGSEVYHVGNTRITFTPDGGANAEFIGGEGSSFKPKHPPTVCSKKTGSCVTVIENSYSIKNVDKKLSPEPAKSSAYKLNINGKTLFCLTLLCANAIINMVQRGQLV